MISVAVDGGTVTLSGRVDSPVERDLAVRLARDLSGVDGVEDRLGVGPSGEAEPEPNRLYRIVRAADASTRVKLRLLWREPVEGLLVDVSTAGDRVALSGVVRSEAGRQLAERIARRSTGVAEVENRLTVDPDASLADAAGTVMTSAARTVSDVWLTTRVAASLRFGRAVDATRIDVSTDNGVVSLSGQAPTAAYRREAAAAAIDGVTRVENRIDIEADDS